MKLKYIKNIKIKTIPSGSNCCINYWASAALLCGRGPKHRASLSGFCRRRSPWSTAAFRSWTAVLAWSPADDSDSPRTCRTLSRRRLGRWDHRRSPSYVCDARSGRTGCAARTEGPSVAQVGYLVSSAQWRMVPLGCTGRLAGPFSAMVNGSTWLHRLVIWSFQRNGE